MQKLFLTTAISLVLGITSDTTLYASYGPANKLKIGSLAPRPGSSEYRDLEELGKGRKLITDNMGEFERGHVIMALSSVPAADRDAFIENVFKLITDDMDGINRGNIIMALASVPAADHEAFIENVFKLITDDMNGDDRGRVVNALAKVPVADHEAFIDNVFKLITDDMNGDSRGRVINTLAKVPVADQGAFIAAVLEKTTDMNGDRRAYTAHVMSEDPNKWIDK